MNNRFGDLLSPDFLIFGKQFFQPAGLPLQILLDLGGFRFRLFLFAVVDLPDPTFAFDLKTSRWAYASCNFFCASASMARICAIISSIFLLHLPSFTQKPFSLQRYTYHITLASFFQLVFCENYPVYLLTFCTNSLLIRTFSHQLPFLFIEISHCFRMQSVQNMKSPKCVIILLTTEYPGDIL